FDLEGVGAIISAHMREPAPAPSTLEPSVPTILDPLVARCLAKRPEERFSSMLEVQQACDELLAQLPEIPTLVPAMVTSDTTLPGSDSVTTLGTSVGQSSGHVHPARLGAWFAIAVAAITAGVVIAVLTARSPSEQDRASAAAAAVAQPANA